MLPGRGLEIRALEDGSLSNADRNPASPRGSPEQADAAPALGHRILLLGASIAISLALLESGLRLATPFPIDSPTANSVEDPRLGKRMNPALPEVDERGYRNPEAIDRAPVVALGDSHTYGYNVDSEASWPAQLSRLIGAPVYNLGIGGFGVLQYHDQLPEALALEPERVLVALYLANDIVSVCGFNRLPQWREQLVGTDTERVLTESCRTLTRSDGTPLETPPAPEGVDRSLAVTAIGSALRHLVWRPLKSELWVRGWIKRDDRSRIAIDDPRNGMLVARRRLVLHAGYMDDDDPHSRALAVFARERLRAMQRVVEEAGARLGVMLVPTRERAMGRYLDERGFDLPPEWERLLEEERAATRSFLDFFAEEGIDAVDIAPYVEAALEKGHVYPRREDGHPLAAGYAAYARGAYEAFFASESDGSASPR